MRKRKKICTNLSLSSLCLSLKVSVRDGVGRVLQLLALQGIEQFQRIRGPLSVVHSSQVISQHANHVIVVGVIATRCAKRRGFKPWDSP